MAIRSIRKRSIGFGIVPVLGLFVVLLVSLSYMSDATHNSERFGELYSWLLVINATGLVILGALVVANIIKLIRQRHNKTVGARLTSRMVLMFVVLAIVPVSIVYYFSLQFLHRGIDSWFDVRIDQALDDALDISRAAVDVRLREALRQTELMAEEISESSTATLSLNLYDHRVRSGAAELTLIGSDGRIVASSSADIMAVVPSQPAPGILPMLREGHHYIGLDPAGDSGMFARALVPVQSSRQDSEIYTLQALFPVSERLSLLADSVQSAFSHYRELAYLRKPLKFSYTLTLSIVLVLSLLGAIWAAFHSARRLVAPIRDLAEATHAVAEGDYSRRLSVASDDELGFLVRSFNDMTRRLGKARDQAHRSQQQIEGQRAYLEAVLANLSSGVIGLDATGVIRAVNSAARESLGVDISNYLGRELRIISDDHAFLIPFIDLVYKHQGNSVQAWREEVSLFGVTGRQVLTCRGTTLEGAGGGRNGGLVIVFDDVTALIQAQRDAAWGEVARRLAHEIKNPLTPIQLSAERLRHRYREHLDEQEFSMLERSTTTIINQVEAMKKMVNAFSEYARAPQISLEPLDLNRIIREVIDLYRSGELNAQIVEHLEVEPACIEGDAGRFRQLLHNLVKNALEAINGLPAACINISTRAAEDAGKRYVELSVADNGPGFRAEVLENIFEPYVSTKPRGGGLGLAIVKKIVEEHGGVITAETGSDGGACVRIRLQLSSKKVAAAGQNDAGNAVTVRRGGL